MKEKLATLLSAWDIHPDNEALDRFELYAKLLEDFGRHLNLVADTDPEEIAVRHFMDSLALLHMNMKNGASAIDVGTGAGFPGVPVKIMRPDLNVTLLDSMGKRLDFLSEVKEKLGLDGLEIINARAEEAACHDEHRDKYDYVFSRAVARMNILTEICLPFTAVGGEFYAMKSRQAAEEAAEAATAVRILGGCFSEDFHYKLPGKDMELIILRVKKLHSTPNGYPRRFSKIKQKPL